jgi:hypothetical protein
LRTTTRARRLPPISVARSSRSGVLSCAIGQILFQVRTSRWLPPALGVDKENGPRGAGGGRFHQRRSPPRSGNPTECSAMLMRACRFPNSQFRAREKAPVSHEVEPGLSWRSTRSPTPSCAGGATSNRWHPTFQIKSGQERRPPCHIKPATCPRLRNRGGGQRNHFSIAAKPSGNHHPIRLPPIRIAWVLIYVEFFSQCG